jgi:hypothetical protein
MISSKKTKVFYNSINPSLRIRLNSSRKIRLLGRSSSAKLFLKKTTFRRICRMSSSTQKFSSKRYNIFNPKTGRPLKNANISTMTSKSTKRCWRKRTLQLKYFKKESMILKSQMKFLNIGCSSSKEKQSLKVSKTKY